MKVKIRQPEEMIEVAIELPLSKSMSNRALIMNALTPGAQPLEAVAVCDDTEAMQSALAAGNGDVNVGPAGTAMRFLTAYYAAKSGAEVRLDGNERMRKRPIGALVDALRQCGADIEYAGEEGFPPLKIKGKQLHGGEIEIAANVSSQFLSALLMVAPTFDSTLTLRLKGEISSRPYLLMTLAMMRDRGIEAELEGNIAGRQECRPTITVQPGAYEEPTSQGRRASSTQEGSAGWKPARLGEPSMAIERDWSAASYWYEIAALSAGFVDLPGLALPSVQGDAAIVQIFEKLGVLTGEMDDEPGVALSASPEVYSRLDVNLSDTPDVAQTLAVTCCMLGVPFHFTGLESLKIKETDRLGALCEELAKLSFAVEEGPGSLQWEGQRIPVREIPTIDAHGDHRMAMAFAPAAVLVDGLMIDGAETVSKSYPGFWDDLRKAGFNIEEI